MQELFSQSKSEKNEAPLADRVRPKSLDEVFGQEELLGEGGPLRAFFESGEFPSVIFWGPPGSGKTTLAKLMAGGAGYKFISLSAVDSGVKEVRKALDAAERHKVSGYKTILFIDEIHRFNKSQQDSLLGAVESGLITLVGATTENPSFEVNSALLSRCHVYKLKPLSFEDIKKTIERALKKDEYLSKNVAEVKDLEFLYSITGGDARAALNAVELSLKYKPKGSGKFVIDKTTLSKALIRKTPYFDKKGDEHYDTISAFIKSMRGSDPDAAILWMTKALEAGEDPKFIARRMAIFASEDVGNADPTALILAMATFEAVEKIGMPECAINLSQCAAYLASCPKSNAAYLAWKEARGVVRSSPSLTVPLKIRNAPTKLMKEEGYAKGYKYPHNYEGGFVEENYFPLEISPKTFYEPKGYGKEKEIKERLEKLWKKRCGKKE